MSMGACLFYMKNEQSTIILNKNPRCLPSYYFNFANRNFNNTQNNKNNENNENKIIETGALRYGPAAGGSVGCGYNILGDKNDNHF